MKGQGVAVLVREHLAPYVTVWRQSRDVQAIWLRVRGGILGMKGDVFLGAIYVNPESTGHTGDGIIAMFEVLLEDVVEVARAYCRGGRDPSVSTIAVSSDSRQIAVALKLAFVTSRSG